MTVHKMRPHTEPTDDLYIAHLEAERATLAEDLAEARAEHAPLLQALARLDADVELLRDGQICLLHQLAVEREFKAAAQQLKAAVLLVALIGGFLAVLALRAAGL